MTRNERFEEIFLQFDSLADAFCRETGGLHCRISSIYDGEQKAENVIERLAEIYYNSHIVFFKYTAHGPLETINSILDCWIKFGKTENSISVPLALVADFCDEDILEPLCIPLISNENCMKQAFSCIGDAVKRLMPKISDISYNEDKKAELKAYFLAEFSEIVTLPGENDVQKYEFASDEYFKSLLTFRFVSAVYILAIKGKTAKAAKKLKKHKRQLNYEKRLLRLWKSGKTTDTSKIPEIVSNIKWLNDSGVAKGSFKELMTIFASALVLMIPFAAVYVGLYFLLILFLRQDSVFLTGVIQNLPFAIFAGFLTGFSFSYFTRNFFMRIFRKKSYEKLLEADQITNSPKSDKFMKVFVGIIVFCCVGYMFLTVNCNVNFKKDGFIDNTEFFSLKGEYHGYDEIECVKYIQTHFNEFGEIDIPSYAIVLKDGSEIDLFDYDEIKNYEDKLLGYLKTKDVKVVK
ncbi:MAG: hypothetical protein KBS52_00065 [Clostridiales bacterium]|nr:hypothetical protein [Candidatus Equinaster intestinalis]